MPILKINTAFTRFLIFAFALNACMAAPPTQNVSTPTNTNSQSQGPRLEIHKQLLSEPSLEEVQTLAPLLQEMAERSEQDGENCGILYHCY